MALENYRNVSAFRCCLCPNPEQPSTENLPDVQLLRCRNCKLISYCGEEHQKKHWDIHKVFCKGITSIRKEWKLKHIMDINGDVTKLTAPQLREVKFMIQSIMVMKLQRDLTVLERELIWFPRVCNLCNSHNGTLIPCPKCFAVGYCCEEHRAEDIVGHLKVCSELHLCYNFTLEELPEDDVKRIPSSAVDANFPKDLFEMHRLSTAFLNKDCVYDYSNLHVPSTSSDYQKFANVCNMSNVATLLHILNMIQDYKTIVTSILTIHIVGANTELALFTRYECWLLFYWLPTIFYIKIIFIGPELPLEKDFAEITYESHRKKTVKIVHKKMKYEEFVRQNGEKNELPDLVVSFNCGFAEFGYSSNNPWRAGITEMFKLKNTPIAFTSYTKTEANSDMMVLRRVADADNCDFDIICDGNLNLFRDLRPFRNFIGYKTDAIYYYNGYLSVLLPK